MKRNPSAARATDLAKLTFTELTGRIASNEPTPGGGSVSALAGALGAALGVMVWRLTQSKGSSGLAEERLDELAGDLERLRSVLLENATADAGSYDGVVAAMRLPKNTDDEKAARQAALQAATRTATEVPLETARLCAAVMESCLMAADVGHPTAVTDAGVGLLMADVGLEGALYNVEINLTGLSDDAYAGTVRAEVASLRARGAALRRKGEAVLGRRLGGS